MRTELLLAILGVLASTLLVGVVLLVRLVRSRRANKMAPLVDDEHTVTRELAQLHQQVERQRSLIGCLVAILVLLLVLVIGALILGYVAIEFLRDLSRGHPG